MRAFAPFLLLAILAVGGCLCDEADCNEGSGLQLELYGLYVGDYVIEVKPDGGHLRWSCTFPTEDPVAAKLRFRDCQ